MIRRLAAFRGHRARHLDDLITALVKRDGTNWNVQFVSDGRVPENFKAPSLDSVTRLGDARVAAIYPPSDPARATAELMYAIYPWRSGGRIFEVIPTPDGLLARSIESPEDTLQAETADGLVDVASNSISDPSDVVFQWVKPVRELRSES